MKKTLLILLVLTKSLYSQNTKIFSDTHNGGKITYSYYIDPDNSEIIKHGNFKYVKKLNNNETNGTYSLIVNGSFQNGFRHGLFKYNIKIKDFPNNANTFTTENSYAILNYKNGLPDGKWEVKMNSKTRYLVFKNGQYVWTNFERNTNEFAKTNFKNGVATGLTSFSDYGPEKVYNFKLDNKGFIIGKYTFKDNLNIYDLNFDSDGVLTKEIVRNKNGKVEHSQEINPELIDFVKKYKNGVITENEMEISRIAIDTLNNSLTFLDYNHIFEQEPFLLRFIGGDKTLSDKTSKTTRIYKRFLDVKKVPYLDLNEDIAFNSIINSPANEKSKMESLESFLERNRKNIKPEDKEILDKRIKNYKVSLEIQKSNQLSKVELEKYKIKLKKLLDNIDIENKFSGLFSDSFNELYKKDLSSISTLKWSLINKFELMENQFSVDTGNLNKEKTKNYSDLLSDIKQEIMNVSEKTIPFWVELKQIKDSARITDLSIFGNKCKFENFEFPGYFRFKNQYNNASRKTYRAYLEVYEKKYKKNVSKISNKNISLFGESSMKSDKINIIKQDIYSEYNLKLNGLKQNLNKNNIIDTFSTVDELGVRIIKVDVKLNKVGKLKNKFIKQLNNTSDLNDKINMILNY